MKKKSNRKFTIVSLLLICAFLFTGCAKVAQADIQFTTGLMDNELFKIDQEVCKTPQAMVLVASQRNSYESVYGAEIWNIPVGQGTFEDVVLDSMKDLLAQMKCMVLMAQEYEISISENEKQRAREAAEQFCRNVDAAQMTALNLTEEDVYQVFYEYRLCNQLITELTKDVDVEISDNDARMVQVQQIFLNADAATMSQEDRQTIYDRMVSVRQRIENGEEFGKLAELYDAGQQSQIALGRGDMPQSYEDVVFALEDGELSQIIETDQGYYLVKCLVAYDMDATQEHKEQMGAMKKKEAFSQLYDTFTAGLTSEFNQSAWEKISMSGGEKLAGADFFGIYQDYFEAQ